MLGEVRFGEVRQGWFCLVFDSGFGYGLMVLVVWGWLTYDRPHNKVPGEILRVLFCRWCAEGLKAVAGHCLVFTYGFEESYGGGEEAGPFGFGVGDG